jgi:hypothetical protein
MKKTPLVRIKLTSSRLDKGLLAIPKRYQRLFPKRTGKVSVLLGAAAKAERKRYTPYSSPARECRIYGLRDWFERRKAQRGDWIELSVVDVANAVYRLVFRKQSREEKRWRQKLQEAETELQATEALSNLAKARWQSQRKAAVSELQRLKEIGWERKRISLPSSARYESIPASLRTLLRTVYQGRCQICGYTFPMPNGQPYFEVHHIDAHSGHQPKNLLLLCANCHAQMEHTDVELERDCLGWVYTVVINGERRPVYQALRRENKFRLHIILAFSLLFGMSYTLRTWLS